jgi:hypothetical protein
MRHLDLLPAGVHRIYNETHRALCEGLPVLTGIGIRAIVEAVCNEKGAAGKNLEQQIDSLKTMSLITPDGASILHSLRFMGNKAAHEVKPHTPEELATAFDVAEYLLKGVYVLPELGNKLPKAPLTSP